MVELGGAELARWAFVHSGIGENTRAKRLIRPRKVRETKNVSMAY